jgi:hypothetical protein
VSEAPARPSCRAFTASPSARAAACRRMKAPMISAAPRIANQIPTRLARTVTDDTGVAVTTTPAMRLTAPKSTHQPWPWTVRAERPDSSHTRPWTIQATPISSPMMAVVRSMCRISTTPSTISSRPTPPSQPRCSSLRSNTRTRWTIPETTSRMPSRTAMTPSELDGCRATTIPSTSVATPVSSIVRHELVTSACCHAGGSGSTGNSSACMNLTLGPLRDHRITRHGYSDFHPERTHGASSGDRLP